MTYCSVAKALVKFVMLASLLLATYAFLLQRLFMLSSRSVRRWLHLVTLQKIQKKVMILSVKLAITIFREPYLMISLILMTMMTMTMMTMMTMMMMTMNKVITYRIRKGCS